MKDGDILLSRKNTRELVGASVFVEKTRRQLMLPDLIFRLVPRTDSPLDSRYLQATLARASIRAALARLAGGSAGSMPNISKARLRSVLIPVPPLELQQTYSRRIRTLGATRSSCDAHFAHLDALFASLQARAFAGEL